MTRLIDMGIEPFLIASSAIGILARRLARQVCDRCKKPYPATPELLKGLGIAVGDVTFYRGEGCPVCKNTGYKGRISIFELMDSRLRERGENPPALARTQGKTPQSRAAENAFTPEFT